MSNSKPVWRKSFKTIAFTLLGAFILFMVFRKTDFNQLLSEASEAKFFWIVLALVVGAWGHWIRAARWTLMLDSMDYKVTTYPGFLSVISGYLINLAIPRAGELSRCALMGQVTGVPVQTLVGTVVTERIIDLIMTVLIIFSVLLLQFQLLYDFTRINFLTPLSTKLNSLIQSDYFSIIVVFIVLIFVLILWFILKKKAVKPTNENKWILLLKGFAKGIKSVFTLKKPILFIVYTFGIWFTYFLSTVCIMQAFEFTASMTLITGLSILMFSTLGVIAPAPGGVGSIYTTKLGLIEIYNLPDSQATTFASILFFTQVVGFVILGTFALIQLGIMKSKAKLNESTRI